MIASLRIKYTYCTVIEQNHQTKSPAIIAKIHILFFFSFLKINVTE